jgi:hypothetical protein
MMLMVDYGVWVDCFVVWRIVLFYYCSESVCEARLIAQSVMLSRLDDKESTLYSLKGR